MRDPSIYIYIYISAVSDHKLACRDAANRCCKDQCNFMLFDVGITSSRYKSYSVLCIGYNRGFIVGMIVFVFRFLSWNAAPTTIPRNLILEFGVQKRKKIIQERVLGCKSAIQS